MKYVCNVRILRTIVSFILACTLLFFLFACGSGSPAETTLPSATEPPVTAPSESEHTLPHNDETTASFTPADWQTTDDTYGGNFITAEEEDGVAIVGYLGLGGVVKIPEMLKEKPVRRIAKAAFAWNKTVTHLYLPDTIHTVDKDAFQHCKVLQEVRWPSGAEIQTGTFSGDTELRRVLLTNCPAIGDSAFSGCTALKDLTLPVTVKSIGAEAFFQCQCLTSIQVSGAEYIGDKAFYNCSSLASLTLASDVWYNADRLGYEFCGNCKALKDFTLQPTGGDAERSLESDHGVLYLGERLICAAAGIPYEEIEVRDGTTIIAPGAFAGCVNLQNVRFPVSPITVGHHAFESCYNIIALAFPGGLRAEDGSTLPMCFADSGISSVFIEGEEYALTDLLNIIP